MSDKQKYNRTKTSSDQINCFQDVNQFRIFKKKKTKPFLKRFLSKSISSYLPDKNCRLQI